MSRDALHEESLKPSRKWVEAGYGNMGTVYVEIIGCEDLPNMVWCSPDVTDSSSMLAQSVAWLVCVIFVYSYFLAFSCIYYCRMLV